jgi:hypothetical protein
LNPGDYLLLCTKTTDGPQFGIGGSDTVTLLDPSGTLVSSTGPLQDQGVPGGSFAYDDTLQAYVYTSTPTPGSENISLSPCPNQKRSSKCAPGSWHKMMREFSFSTWIWTDSRWRVDSKRFLI